MRTTRTSRADIEDYSDHFKLFFRRRLSEITGIVLLVAVITISLALITWSANDPSLNQAANHPVSNILGFPGAIIADLAIQVFGLAALLLVLPFGFLGLRLMAAKPVRHIKWRLGLWLICVMSASGAISAQPIIGSWPLPIGMGGVIGDAMQAMIAGMPYGHLIYVRLIFDLAFVGLAALGTLAAAGVPDPFASDLNDEMIPIRKPLKRNTQNPIVEDNDESFATLKTILTIIFGFLWHMILTLRTALVRWYRGKITPDDPFSSVGARAHGRREPGFDAHPDFGHDAEAEYDDEEDEYEDEEDEEEEEEVVRKPRKAAKPKRRGATRGGQLDLYTPPPVTLLSEAKKSVGPVLSSDALEENARMLEGVLEDFGVRGEIINVRPGPVVTLYELEPAPGIKSSRVINLADDIARSMSAVSARVAVVPGRNAIGIELPNSKRETVYLREMVASPEFKDSPMKLALGLGKTIGGEPVIVDLARMPHLLVAGTTGSGKSVAINTMILSLVYRLTPEQCRLIMVDPKMLELSVYDGIPHLLTPVVTDPKKAVVALKWAVREMEERYKKMAKLGVRNIDGFNARVLEAKDKGEVISRTVQTGFDRDTGEAIFENQVMDLEQLPYIVVIVDEMADLMMVAGKDIEGAIQRLAQMARAAGIHVILATQRPSVDVITGTIKANFPTRISFQVTSKIDSRTILGEQGAEQLLGQGDMLFMMGGGRISRVHGPFVSDGEVEKIVAHLKSQGQPDYLEEVTKDDQPEFDEDGSAVFDNGSFGDKASDPYDQAVQIVIRDRRASTSYIQRRLQIGYNRAATIMERMEREGIVGAPNHAGKREILIEARESGRQDDDEF